MFGGPSGRLPISSASHNFSQVPRANVPRSAFDRSHSKKLTCQASALVPIFLDEVLPGDSFRLNSTIFARLATPLVPLMDNMVVETQYFFAPMRLLWNNAEKFFGAQDNPGDSISYTIPQIGPAASFAVMTLPDYMGLPPGPNYGGTAGFLNALPFRMANRVYNEWYRDENIQNSLPLSLDDGPDPLTDYVLQIRGKRKDYFYGSLTAAQKGTAVPFLSGTANVYGSGIKTRLKSITSGGFADIFYETSAPDHYTAANVTGSLNDNDLMGFPTKADIAGGAAPTGLITDLSTNLTDVVNTLRLAFQTQKFLERDARGGTRYIELILSHFGVTNPDFRLQRTEYLGGGTSQIQYTPVPNTSDTGTGDLAAFGTALSPNNGFFKSFTEHGYILGFMSIRAANLTYQQGVHKLWARQTRYDIYWPVFAHLGEQTVLRKEIYYVGDKATTNLDDTIWGYQERWAEYRYKPSEVCGLFRSAASQTLDAYHLAQDYASPPALNSTWLPDDTAINLDRNLGVTHSATVAQFKVDIFHKLHTARAMPVFSVPGNIDRF